VTPILFSALPDLNALLTVTSKLRPRYHFVIPMWREKTAKYYSVKRYCKIIADNLSKARWSWGCVSTINSSGKTIFVADAYRGDGKRFVVHADEKLTAFVELESAMRGCG
jgi:hypothetical protein